MKRDTTERPVRVAMVHYRDSAVAGGSLRVGETIANHVDPDRVAMEMVFAYGPPGPVSARAKVPCHFLGAAGPKDMAAWVRARSLFRRLQPDIVHFQDGIVWLRGALLGTSCKKLVHVHARVARPAHPFARRHKTHPFRASALMRNYLRFTDAQICINHGARNILLDLGWIREGTSGVVYNSIDVSRFGIREHQREAREKLGLPRDARLLGMVARLVWEKGCADLLQLVKLLPDDWHAAICGDGPLKPELQRQAEHLGLSERIHFLGSQDDVRIVYAALDAYAFLSLYEPFGLVLAEAMVMGLPVFGIQSDGEFNEAGFPLFAGGRSLLVPFERAGDYDRSVPRELLEEVARRITEFGQHPDAYRNEIERAQRWVSTCFDAPVQAEAMTEVYYDLNQRGIVSSEKLTRFYAGKRAGAESQLFGDRQQALAATG